MKEKSGKMFWGGCHWWCCCRYMGGFVFLLGFTNALCIGGQFPINSSGASEEIIPPHQVLHLYLPSSNLLIIMNTCIFVLTPKCCVADRYLMLKISEKAIRRKTTLKSLRPGELQVIS